MRDLVHPEYLDLLLMEEFLHLLRLVVSPIIYRVSYIPGGAGFLPSTVCARWFQRFVVKLLPQPNCRAKSIPNMTFLMFFLFATKKNTLNVCFYGR